MITIEIGYQKFAIESLAQAENLLNIFSTAQQVEQKLIADDYVMCETDRPADVSVSIVHQSKVLTKQESEERIAAAEKKNQQQRSHN